MSLSIPPLPPFQPNWPDFQVWWQIAKQAIEGEFGALETADDALAAALAAAHTADWSGVVDDNSHKPEDDATLGADLATNVINVIPKNLPATTAASNAFGFTGAISYTSTATSATISVAAGTFYAGQAIPYNAMSVGVSGSGTQTFYLYVTGATWNNAGAHTLHASTSSLDTINAVDIAYIGKVSVTFTASGSGSGTGGGGGEIGGGCVTEDTKVPNYASAGDVPVAGEMAIANPITHKERRGTVTKNDARFAQCVRIISESGVKLKCSRDARIGNHHGGLVYAPDLLGVVCPVRVNGEWRDEKVVMVEPIGEQRIRHITCENDLFLAGEEDDAYFLHHNLKNI